MRPFILVYSPQILDVIQKISAFFGSISGINAITLWPFVITRTVDEDVILHETAHVYQQLGISALATCFVLPIAIFIPQILFFLPLLWAPYVSPFYIIYGVEYLYNRYFLKMDGFTAYNQISFEIHAYEIELIGEIKFKDTFGWIKYWSK